MKKIDLLTPITVALLAACGGNTPIPPILTSLTLGGVAGPLQISVPVKLNVMALDANGAAFSGTPTFTSSDSNVIAVDINGNLTVRHLSIEPVVLTVNVDGKTATLSATTFGLDVSGGTYTYDTGAPSTYIFAAFRDVNGKAVMSNVAYNIQGPTSFNSGKVLSQNFFPNSIYNNFSTFIPAVTGTYTASAAVNGIEYVKIFNINADLRQKLAQGSANVTQTGYSANSASYTIGCDYLIVQNTLTSTNAVTPCLSTTTTNGTWYSTLPSGIYNSYLFSRNYTAYSGNSMLDQINLSVHFLGKITLP